MRSLHIEPCPIDISPWVKELLLKNPLVFMVKSSRNDTFAFEEKPALARSKLGTPAAFYGNSEKIVQYLVEKGANLNVKTRAGQTALDIASNIAPKGRVERNLVAYWKGTNCF
jgi:ankyrin repeat protein